jgi:hypothetical protein
MDPVRLSTVLEAGVVIAIVAGVALILNTGPALTGVGVLLVIAGLIGLMPALKFQLEANPPGASD